MGCFNMRCAVTGVPIVAGTDCVMIRIGWRKDQRYSCIEDFYAMCSLPRFGQYNDYGSIENEDEIPNWRSINMKLQEKAIEMEYVAEDDDRHHNYDVRWMDEAMFILREVYDKIIAVDLDSRKYPLDIYATYGDKRKAGIAKLEEDIKFYIEAKTDSTPLMTDLLCRQLLKREISEHYGMSQCEEYIWSDAVYDDRSVGELYHKYLYPLIISSYQHHWTIKPSVYAGQDVYPTEMLEIRDIGTKYLLKIQKEFEDDDY